MLLNSRVGVKYRKFTKIFLSAEEWKTLLHMLKGSEREEGGKWFPSCSYFICKQISHLASKEDLYPKVVVKCVVGTEKQVHYE